MRATNTSANTSDKSLEHHATNATAVIYTYRKMKQQRSIVQQRRQKQSTSESLKSLKGGNTRKETPGLLGLGRVISSVLHAAFHFHEWSTVTDISTRLQASNYLGQNS